VLLAVAADADIGGEVGVAAVLAAAEVAAQEA
jgi:hypothetical protein